MAGRRRRVKEIKDDIEVFSLNSRKTRKIPRRHFETAPNVQKHGVEVGGQLDSIMEGSSSSQRICEITFDNNEGQESVDAGNVKSAYYKRKEKQLEKWDDMRSLMVKSFIEACCLPEGQLCVLCEEKFAIIRCLECGYGQYYCHECACLIHRDRNIFHFLEEWKEGTFSDLQNIPNLGMPTGSSHAPNCFENIRRICVITNNGFQKHCDITFCDCIPDAVILIKNGLWPVSPTVPTVALQVELMAHLESLFLEAQLSLNSFCNCIKWKQVFSGRPSIVSDLYNSLSSNDTFEQYRQFIYNIRFLRTLCPDTNNGTECPACPKESGTTFWNFDACFGLFRKKSAGKHPLPSVHGPLYFEEQEIVDDFLNSYKISRKETELENEKECSQFQAGGDVDGMHCKGKNNLFDEKAIFGCVCRHEYPLRFLDIKHGERFGYIIYLLEQLLELDQNKPIQRKVVYDIGCKLHRHVELTKNKKILGKVAFMLPSFHAFAHSTSCQMKYSIFYQEGSGFSNGEQCERLWSYLRCFSSMTREMTAAHRQDALTDALLYYSRKILMKTGFLTVNRLTGARDARTTSAAELQKLLVDLQAEKEQVLDWEKQLSYMSANRKEGQTGVRMVAWQMKYIRLLLLHRQLSDDLANFAGSIENVTVTPVLNKLRRIDKQLKQIEEKNNVRRRWKIDQPTVYECVEAVEEEERREVVEKLRAVAFDRWFLLSLKRKYSTGQKIAKILTRSINVKVANMKEILRNYNQRSAIKMNLVPGKVNKIEYKDAIDIQSAIYQGLPSFEGDTVPSDLKRKAVELNLTNRRATEEIDLCRQDMICTINHLIAEKKKIVLAAEYHVCNPVSSRYSRGAVSLLNQKIVQLDGMISCYGKMFIDAEGITQDEVDSFSLQSVELLNIPFPVTTSQWEDLSDDENEATIETESDDYGTGLHDENISDNDFSLFLSEDSD